jgi:hypothetical protein
VAITGEALTSLTTRCIGGSLNSGTRAAGFVASRYWSSSEPNAGAWSQFFSDGFQASKTKSHTSFVRPVRAF